ncbi:MAG TPA: DUF3108 domain-containing protein, partial [Steroidobacteraceae bacterium]|nr:DUF3108 domain-containing protein [Steroidobacteraceae bacterium]
MTSQFARLAFCSLALCASGAMAQTDLGVPPFTGTYTVEYRGIRAGTIDFILRAEADHYVYEMRTHPRGLAKMVVNDNVREASEFTVENGAIKPRYYELEDGSKSTDDDTRLKFDWPARRASGTHENKPIEIALADGVQDRMSAQVVVMQYLLAGKQFDKLAFIDRDALKEYSYQKIKEEKLKTALGELDTIVYASSRPGSNRVSRLWYAPSL